MTRKANASKTVLKKNNLQQVEENLNDRQIVNESISEENNSETSNMERQNYINGLALISSNFEGDRNETEFFFRQFEEISIIAKWTPQEKLTILKAKLKGNALQFLMSDRELINSQNYDFVRDKIVDFFSSELPASESQMHFANIYMRENEEIRNLVHRINIATKNYLGTDESENSPSTKKIIDKFRLTKLISSLLPEIQKEVVKANPKSFDEAVMIDLVDCLLKDAQDT